MEFKEIRNGHVQIEASGEGNLFAGFFREHAVLGRTAVVFDVSDEDTAALQAGDVTVLPRLFQPDPDRPGHYLTETRVSIHRIQGGVTGVRDFQELTPYTP